MTNERVTDQLKTGESTAKNYTTYTTRWHTDHLYLVGRARTVCICLVNSEKSKSCDESRDVAVLVTCFPHVCNI